MRIFEGKISEALLTILGLCLILGSIVKVFPFASPILYFSFFCVPCLAWFLSGKIGDLFFRHYLEKQKSLDDSLKKLKSATAKRLIQICFKFRLKPQRNLQFVTASLMLIFLGHTLQIMGEEGASTWEGILLLSAFTWGLIAGEKLYRAVPWLRSDHDEKASTTFNSIEVKPQTQKVPLYIKGAVLFLLTAAVIGYFCPKSGLLFLGKHHIPEEYKICIKYKQDATTLLMKLEEIHERIINKKITYEEYKGSLKRIKPLIKTFRNKYGQPEKKTDHAKDEIAEVGQSYSFYFICNSFNPKFPSYCNEAGGAIPI